MGLDEFHGFYENLCKTVEESSGLYDELIEQCPKFFKLLCDILNDEDADWHTRLLINSALAYFVAPKDIIAEEDYGAMGYIDDIFLCSYVLNEIKNKVSSELILKNWKGEEDILELIDKTFEDSKKVVGKKYSEILEFAGLKKRIDVNKIEKESESEIVQKLTYQNIELLTLLSFVVRQFYQMYVPGETGEDTYDNYTKRFGRPTNGRIKINKLSDVKQLKEFIEKQDEYGEIKEIMRIIHERKKTTGGI